jgi:acetyl esterase/lipase
MSARPLPGSGTIHFVAPELRELAKAIPVFDPTHDTVVQIRDSLAGAMAQLIPPCTDAFQDHHIPGPAGAPNVRVLLRRPERVQAHAAAILYIHGGGFIAGNPDMFVGAVTPLADAAEAMIVAVDYRLAPGTSFPGPLEDCYATLEWLFQNADELGVDPDRIAVFGDSAGGGLAAALALLARDRGQYRLAAQILAYPMLDARTGTGDAPVDNATTGEFIWTREANHFGWQAMRVAGAIDDDRIAYFSPSLARDLSGLPPTFIGVGAVDLFLEEDVAYALRLSRADVPVEAHVYEGAFHAFDQMGGPLAERFRGELTGAVARLLRGNPVI